MKGSAISKTSIYANGYAYLILPDAGSPTGYSSYMLNLSLVFGLFVLASNYTASDILTKLLTVDGSGSGLDADKLDGNEASAFAAANHNHDSAYAALSHTHSIYAALAGATFTGDIVGTNIQAKHKRTIQSTTSTSTFTHNCSSYDTGKITAQAAGLTMAAPTGTPYDLQEFVLYLKDNGVSRSISWNAAFSGVMAALPSATTVGKQMVFFFVYNTATSKWELMNLAIGV